MTINYIYQHKTIIYKGDHHAINFIVVGSEKFLP